VITVPGWWQVVQQVVSQIFCYEHSRFPIYSVIKLGWQFLRLFSSGWSSGPQSHCLLWVSLPATFCSDSHVESDIAVTSAPSVNFKQHLLVYNGDLYILHLFVSACWSLTKSNGIWVKVIVRILIWGSQFLHGWYLFCHCFQKTLWGIVSFVVASMTDWVTGWTLLSGMRSFTIHISYIFVDTSFSVWPCETRSS